MQWYSSPNLQNQTKDSNDKFSTKPNIFFVNYLNQKFKIHAIHFFLTTAVFISKQNKK